MIRNCRGVTLLELLMTIAIIGVLASLAIPAFDNQLKNSKLRSSANLLLTAYGIARSEAINRGVDTEVTGDSYGWIVATIASVGPPAVAAETLNEFQADNSGITWDPAVLPAVTFLSTGFRPFGGGEQVIELCDERGVGREITITSAGSISVETLPSC